MALDWFWAIEKYLEDLNSWMKPRRTRRQPSAAMKKNKTTNRRFRDSLGSIKSVTFYDSLASACAVPISNFENIGGFDNNEATDVCVGLAFAEFTTRVCQDLGD